MSIIDDPPKNDIDIDDPRSGDRNQMLFTDSIKSHDNIHMMTSSTTKSNLSLTTACSYSKKMKFINDDYNTKAVCKYAIKSGETISFTKYTSFVIVFAMMTRRKVLLGY